MYFKVCTPPAIGHPTNISGMNGCARVVDGINLRYIYSACVVTETPDLSILHDPWFTDGIYDGTWFQFPKIADPVQTIGDVDLIFISHIHPDHYDPIFLKEYFGEFGEKQILIADRAPNFLKDKMIRDGFSPTVLTEPLRRNSTEITVLPVRPDDVNEIDSALVLKFGDASGRTHCLVNLNDVIMDSDTRATVKAVAGPIDLLLLGFTGAGPYPQTYYDLEAPALPLKAQEKKEEFFDRYLETVKELGARKNLPFAGQYLLGSSLAKLNPFRGVADATEILSIDPDALVLEEANGSVCSCHLVPVNPRVDPFSPDDVAMRERETEREILAYERFLPFDQVDLLPLGRLLFKAHLNALRRGALDEPYYFVFELPDGNLAVLPASKSLAQPDRFTEFRVVARDCDLPEPRSEIRIDPRYLFGLLTGVFHWNNAEVGSGYMTRRFPDVFRRDAQAFLNWLVV